MPLIKIHYLLIRCPNITLNVFQIMQSVVFFPYFHLSFINITNPLQLILAVNMRTSVHKISNAHCLHLFNDFSFEEG